jgi:hypothetical protein
MPAPPSNRGLRVYSAVAAGLAATGTAFGFHEQNANSDAQRRASEARVAVDAARRTALNAIAHDRATTRWALRATTAIRKRHDVIVRRSRADQARLVRQIRAARASGRTVYVDGGVIYRSQTVYVDGGGGSGGGAAAGGTAAATGGSSGGAQAASSAPPTTKTS